MDFPSRNINEILQVNEETTLNYNQDITLTDGENNISLVCRCYCSIQAYRNISYHCTVEDMELFTKHKDLIQVEIEKFKTEARRIATDNNVPII